MNKKLLVSVCVFFPINALAHLTWIDTKSDHLSLSTGHHFPVREILVTGQYVSSLTCEQGGNTYGLQYSDTTVRYPISVAPDNCLVILKTTNIVLTPTQGVQHLSENKVDNTLIQTAKTNAQFREEYFKSAQLSPIALNSALYQQNIAQFIRRPDDPEAIYVYRNGNPLANLSVGLEYPQTPITLWSKTDANGKVKLLLKPKTTALLRALVTEENNQEFKSQFLSVILKP